MIYQINFWKALYTVPVHVPIRPHGEPCVWAADRLTAARVSGPPTVMGPAHSGCHGGRLRKARHDSSSTRSPRAAFNPSQANGAYADSREGLAWRDSRNLKRVSGQ